MGLWGFLFSSPPAQAQSQAKINAETQESFEKSDALLNKSYKDLLARNDEDPSFAGVLKEAQRAWLKYVELHMTSVFPLIEGENPKDVYGTSYPAEYNIIKTTLYKQRIDLLNAMTVEEDMPESEPAPLKEKAMGATTPSAQAGPDNPGSPPQIKGLAIGMGFSRLPLWFDAKLKKTNIAYEIFTGGETNVFMIARSDNLRYLQEQDKGEKSPATLREYQLKNLPNGHQEVPSFIEADAKGTVLSIVLQPSLVNYLFQAKDIEFSEFKKLFVDSYLKDLPINDTSDSFSWTTENGVKITVGSDKTLVMKKVAEPTKVKGAFN